MDFIFRKMKESDWQGIYDVELSAFGGGFSKYFVKMAPIFFGINSFVVEYQTKIVGYSLGVIPNGQLEEGWIMSAGIEPKHQGKGLGKKLLNMTIDALKKNGAKRILLTVSPDNQVAKSTYEKRGFKEFTFIKDYYGEGEDRIVMQLR
ncbi:GNAT family N-acetyltransferase [Alkalicella caledoniensis]|uniref:GNAT family N-acetyltransferase n=1 Tax=Alkalicella caledoniensis TaxID=2731377 RepID=A0A7G9W564_ALKCA|nr:GNAT family N-acetyltransferase [Alkalicella caledoniensis]QNO13826.1 GNAT family N-acetyltransferase [Alkalicella caledoniensis]